MDTVRDKILNALTLFYQKIKSIFIQTTNVVNNCASTSTTYPLSAAQGTSLQGQIDDINSTLDNHIKLNTFCMSYTRLNISGSNKTSVDIKFSDISPTINFVQTPVIIAVLETDWTDVLKLTIHNTSTTGFTAIVHNSIPTGTTVTIHWIARGHIA